MGLRASGVTWAVVAAGVVVLAGCGSSSGGGGTTSPTTSAGSASSSSQDAGGQSSPDQTGSGQSGAQASATDVSGVPALSSLKGRKLVISTWGGVWTDSTKKYFTDPFSAATGVNVQFVVNGNDTVAPVLLQVQNHAVNTDLIDGGALAPMLINNALEPLPAGLKTQLEASSRPDSVSDYAWSNYGTTATLIVCNPAVVQKCPSNAKEFWDTKDFPGPRAMTSNYQTSMVFALLADGVTGDVKTVDIPRAIKKLNEIKPAIKVWTTSGSQQQQVISDGEVGISYMWNGRAYVVKQSTVPNLIMNWGDSTYTVGAEGFGVPKGAPNADVAFAFLSWISQHPQNQAQWTSSLTYPTPTKDLFDLVSKDVAAALPSPDKTTNYDSVWMAQNATALQQAWQQFLTG